jgi:pentapeptide repeat protein
MTKRNKSPPKKQGTVDKEHVYRQGMLYRIDYGDRPLPMHKLILDHQRWLNSNGRFGQELDLDGLWFNHCDLDGVDLSRARLEGAYFEGGSARGARFVGTDLYMATFESCDVEGADFSGARLDWSTFATNHEHASFEGATCDHVAFSMEDRDRNRQVLSDLRRAGFKLISSPSRRLGRKNDGPSP